MNDKDDEYVCTTDVEQYRNWEWFNDYLRLNEEFKNRDASSSVDEQVLGPLAVDIGLDFCSWVMETAELRDILFRRFVLGDYHNQVEGNLLGFGQIYFCYNNQIHTSQASSLTSCWRPLARVLKGEISSISSEEFRELLLQSPRSFSEVAGQA